MSDDLPTLERPAKAISNPSSAAAIQRIRRRQKVPLAGKQPAAGFDLGVGEAILVDSCHGRAQPEPRPAMFRWNQEARRAAKSAVVAAVCRRGREDIMDDWSSVRLCDVVNLVLSGVLFFSPWLFDLSSGAQWQTASTVGIVIAVLSIAALAAFAVWEEWFILIAALALIVSPWLLGFQNSDAMTIDVAIGVIVAALAAFEVWLTRDRAPQITASR